MIRTQYGSELEIIEGQGGGWALCKRISDGALRQWHASQLTADTIEEFERLAEIGNMPEEYDHKQPV